MHVVAAVMSMRAKPVKVVDIIMWQYTIWWKWLVGDKDHTIKSRLHRSEQWVEMSYYSLF